MFATQAMVAAALLSAAALAAEPSDRAQVCGSAMGMLFEHPQCNPRACVDNWPRGQAARDLARDLCTGSKTLHYLMGLCCVESADDMQIMIEQAVASSAPALPAVRPFPRVPIVPRTKVQQQAFADTFTF